MINNVDDASTIPHEESTHRFQEDEIIVVTEETTTTETTTILGDCEPVPDICEGYLDDVTLINDEIYVFKQNYVWKFDKYFNIENDYPKTISKVFPNLPKRFRRINAIYQDPHDRNELMIFHENEFISYDMRGPIFTAFNITRYTYDPEISRIDAAMVWSKNNRTYLFSSDRFWKFSKKYQMDAFYPRVMARWKGVPSNLDAIVSIPNRKTIFFKQDEFWEYDDEKLRLRKGFPKKTMQLFNFC